MAFNFVKIQFCSKILLLLLVWKMAKNSNASLTENLNAIDCIRFCSKKICFQIYQTDTIFHCNKIHLEYSTYFSVDCSEQQHICIKPQFGEKYSTLDKA